jgi:heterodisulfide reductase subunit A
VPGRAHQKFYEDIKNKGTQFYHYDEIKVMEENGSLQINYTNSKGEDSFQADMVIISPAMIPAEGTKELAGILDIALDERGFFAAQDQKLSPVLSDREGVFVTGCAEGPKDIPESIAQAEAAAGKILSSLREG